MKPFVVWILGAAVALAMSGCTEIGSAGAPTDEADGSAGAHEGDDGAFVRGRVVDTELVPIAGATVAAEPDAVAVTETDENGSFKLGPLAPGDVSVVAEKTGYRSSTLSLSLIAGETETVTLVIEATAQSVPYKETLPRQGYLMCHVVVLLPSPFSGGLNAPCAAATDLVIGPGTLPDRWVFPFTVDKPGFSTLALEMTWTPQQFGKDGLLQLTTVGRAEASGSGVTVAGTVYGDTQKSPFRAILTPGKSYRNDSKGQPVIFYPVPNATEKFSLLFAGGEGNNTLPRTAFFLDFRSTIYISLFYNRPMPADFSALPDE